MPVGMGRWMSQLKQESKFTLLLPFYSSQSLNGLDDAHCTGKGDLSYLVNQFKY